MPRLTNFLLAHNQKQSATFCSPDATLLRREYRSKFPTRVGAMKCMDGRLNLSIMTKTPPGIIQPFRNIGGTFDLGWPYFGELLSDWVNDSITAGVDCLILVTYHWSKGKQNRGCKGHNYDKGIGFRYTKNLKQQVERVFGKIHSAVYPVQVGIETDEDALVLHGSNGATFDLSTAIGIKENELRHKLQQLFPDMKQRMLQDFLPLLLGNIEHIAEVRNIKRPVAEVEHGEQILAIGRGFDWLHLPNKALIIGPYSYNLGQPIKTAAEILIHNLKTGRTPKKDGAVLMSSAVYWDEAGPEPFRAVEKAESLANFSMETIREHVPELIKYIRSLVGIVNLNTRLFTPVNEFKQKQKMLNKA